MKRGFAIMIMIAASGSLARAEVNYDDPNLARGQVFASEASAICSQQAAKGARAMENCLRSYGFIDSSEASEALYLVHSSTDKSAGDDSTTRAPSSSRSRGRLAK